MSSACVPHDHAVAFYDHDAELVAQLADYVAAGLGAGQGVAVVATAVHRAALASVLAQRGIALDPAQYLAVDAAQTLAACCADGDPDGERFRATVGGLLEAAGAGDRPVRVFGEMVALLWEAGDVVGALELEARWNALGQERAFVLLCAYPTSALVDGSGLHRLADVCAGHSSVAAPGSYASDVTVLGRPEGAGRSETFVPVPAAVRMARRFVTCTLQAWDRPDLVADAELLVSELATNALLHAGTPFQVSMTRPGPGVRIAVLDVAASAPQRRVAGAGDTSGRGTGLLDVLADRWGVGEEPAGKSVWVELGTARG